MPNALLTGFDVDRILRYPAGRSERLAKKGKLPSIVLPDGEIRFRADDIEALIARPATGLEPQLGGRGTRAAV